MATSDTTPIPKLNRTTNNSPLLVGTTDFSRLTRNQKSVWVKKLWQYARNFSFIMRFSGTSPNSMIQRITELTSSERGEKAIIQLIQDLTGQGVTGDYALEGREEEMRSFDTEITIDQLRNATRNVGRMTTQRNILNFREQSKDKLAYWLADTIDQLGILTLSGIPYNFNCDGSMRVDPRGGTPRNMTPEQAVAIGSFSGTKQDSYGYSGMSGTSLMELEFAKRVHLPTQNRCFRWKRDTSGSAGHLVSLKDEVGANLTEKRTNHIDNITKNDYLSYQALVTLRAELKTQKMRGIRGNHGDEFYHIFVHPKAYLKLKLDKDYIDSLKYAANRGSSNPIFSGGAVTIDGMIIHEYNNIFNTLKSAPGLKAGIDSNDSGKKTTAKGKLNKAKADYVTATAAYQKAFAKYEAAVVADENAPTVITKKAVNDAKKDVNDTKTACDVAKKAVETALITYKSFSNSVDYCRVLVCGSQALGMCTLDGVTPLWVEKEFDYDNSMGIASGKVFGFEKPQFPNREYIMNPANFSNDPYEHLEDFGVAVLDVAI